MKNEKDLIDTWENPYVDLVFVCKICRKTQPHRCNWKRHFLSHSEQSFTCDICGKEFKNKYSHNKHVKTHVKTNFYSDELC